MPPLTDKTAGVLFDEPIRTPDTGVDVKIILPVPLGVSVRLPLLLVARVSPPSSVMVLFVKVSVSIFVPLTNVPTLVKDDPVIEKLSEVPVKVPAAAVIVIFP